MMGDGSPWWVLLAGHCCPWVAGGRLWGGIVVRRWGMVVRGGGLLFVGGEWLFVVGDCRS